MRKYYPGITLFKLGGAVLVALTHISKPAINVHLNNAIHGFTLVFSIIVPCFYMIAGFLAFQGWTHATNSYQYIRRYLGWLIGIYGIFCLYFICTDLFPALYNGTFSSKHLINLFKHVVLGVYQALWFIPPLILAVGLAYIAVKKHIFLKAFSLTLLVFFVLQFEIGSLSFITDAVFEPSESGRFKYYGVVARGLHNYFAMGFPFVFAGIYAGHIEEKFLRINSTILSIVIVSLTLLELLALQVFYPDGYTKLTMISVFPMTVWLFYGILKYRNLSIKKHHHFIWRISILLYLAHVPIINLVKLIFDWHKMELTTAEASLCALITFCSILILERLFKIFQEKKQLASKTKNIKAV